MYTYTHNNLLTFRYNQMIKEKEELEVQIEKLPDPNTVLELEDHLKSIKNTQKELLKYRTQMEVQLAKVDKAEPDNYDQLIEKLKYLRRKKDKIENEIGIDAS